MCRRKKKRAYDRRSIFVVAPFSDIPTDEDRCQKQTFHAAAKPEHPYVISIFALPPSPTILHNMYATYCPQTVIFDSTVGAIVCSDLAIEAAKRYPPLHSAEYWLFSERGATYIQVKCVTSQNLLGTYISTRTSPQRVSQSLTLDLPIAY